MLDTSVWTFIRGIFGYCKFGNFRENFIFENDIKRHICEVRNSRLGHDNRHSDFAISRGFHSDETSHMRSFAKIKLLRKSEFTLCDTCKYRNILHWLIYMYIVVNVHEGEKTLNLAHV